MLLCSLQTTPRTICSRHVCSHSPNKRIHNELLRRRRKKKSRAEETAKQKGRHTEKHKTNPDLYLFFLFFFFGFVDSLDGAVLAPATRTPAWTTTHDARSQQLTTPSAVLFVSRFCAISAAASVLAHLSLIDVFWCPL